MEKADRSDIPDIDKKKLVFVIFFCALFFVMFMHVMLGFTQVDFVQ